MVRTTFLPWSIIAACFLAVIFPIPGNRTGHARESVAVAAISAAPDPFVGSLLRQVDRERALNDLRRLTGEAPVCIGEECHTINNRLTGSVGLQWALDYLYENLAGLGFWMERGNWSASSYSGQNIIVRKEGAVAPDEEILVAAHVDGILSSGGRSATANDNASGTVDLLELARIVSNCSFERTIVLLFTTGEEQGTLGVRAYLNNLSAAAFRRIKFAVDVDMVGFDGNGDRIMELWHGGQASSVALTQMMNDNIRAYQLNLNPKMITGCG